MAAQTMQRRWAGAPHQARGALARGGWAPTRSGCRTPPPTSCRFAATASPASTLAPKRHIASFATPCRLLTPSPSRCATRFGKRDQAGEGAPVERGQGTVRMLMTQPVRCNGKRFAARSQAGLHDVAKGDVASVGGSAVEALPRVSSRRGSIASQHSYTSGISRSSLLPADRPRAPDDQ